MKNIVRNILAVIIGIIAGSLVNMGIVMLCGRIVPPPAGVDMTSLESIKASIHLFQAKHFIAPFLAHALGTFTSALVASLIARSGRLIIAMLIGGLSLLGGIVAAFLIPAPFWFIALDLIVAYLPMAWLGWKLSGQR